MYHALLLEVHECCDSDSLDFIEQMQWLLVAWLVKRHQSVGKKLDIDFAYQADPPESSPSSTILRASSAWQEPVDPPSKPAR